jgi:hypothetical protein
VQLVGYLALAVQRVEGRGDAAGQEDAMQGRGVLGAVGRQDADGLPLADPGVVKHPRYLPRRVPHVSEGVCLLVGADESRLVAALLRRIAQQIR